MSSNRTVGALPVMSLLLGASLWGVVWYPLRGLEHGGLQGVWLTLILYATALVFSLPRTARHLPEFLHSPRDLGILLFAAGWTNVAFVLAILDGNILRVLLLFYLSPPVGGGHGVVDLEGAHVTCRLREPAVCHGGRPHYVVEP